MDLFNTTAVPAALQPMELEGLADRLCFVSAKASFSFDSKGNVTPETDDPTPLFVSDEETELGLLPRDDLPAAQPLFDVILLGVAHAPNGNPTRQMNVTLSVGDVQRRLSVSGDRIWEGRGDKARIGMAEPFLTMPLTYSRAFGGRGTIMIDRDAEVELTDARNPEGRGFDISRDAEGLRQLMKPPAGYPRLGDEPRALPNIEDPEDRVRTWEDNPEPACWATLPLGNATHGLRSVDQEKLAERESTDTNPPLTGQIYQRASLGWVIPPPSTGARVSMRGVFAKTREIELPLPTLAVFADVCVGAQSAELPLPPRMLVLEPERMRLYLVYRAAFPYPFGEGEERSVRIRTEWPP